MLRAFPRLLLELEWNQNYCRALCGWKEIEFNNDKMSYGNIEHIHYASFFTHWYRLAGLGLVHLCISITMYNGRICSDISYPSHAADLTICKIRAVEKCIWVGTWQCGCYNWKRYLDKIHINNMIHVGGIDGKRTTYDVRECLLFILLLSSQFLHLIIY